MLSVSYEERHDIIDVVKYLPCVSVIIPFDPKMGQKSAIESRLRSAMNKVKKELQENYPDEKALPVFQKLSSLIQNLNYGTHKKSIAVFVSPLVEKVFYLDMPVKEKIALDESFEIRDVVYTKKEMSKFLVLVLSNKFSNIFLGDSAEFKRIVCNTPDHVVAFKNDIAESAVNFSDVLYKEESLLDKFLLHTDNALGIILKSYPLPLFVMATDQLITHFKKITHNNDCILDYVLGNFEEANETEIRRVIFPYVADWAEVKQHRLLRELITALESKRLATGIEEVTSAASLHKGRLLVVEKSYTGPVHHGLANNIYGPGYGSNINPFYIKNVVDEVIDKVLENGGDVEFVDDDVLKNYGHIALIQFF